MEFISVYDHFIAKRYDATHTKLQYLESGLKKLTEATQYVDSLSSTAKLKEEELSRKQNEADLALKQITDSMVNANTQKTEMEILSSKLITEVEHILKRKALIEKELEEVEPLINSAKAAVGDIRPGKYLLILK